ncbi:sugar ABC transporter ATP-binding protein [Acidobacteria bacterium ACD]|nr:MAG: sugar ABC transporter ATP-binding protein [Acidobacteriota bacterium]MCE7959250.1 sugar ABC transporter ATP-binding protein [Acidobacteria bacterium ACB2]MDL1950469.1 sugar ABC transporter ATP-binding protein [Acidobacteria bacterium ACD]
MTEAAPLLAVRSVTKSFPGVTALDGVTFDLRAGEVHALVGENGAGKSTLLSILGGIHPAGSFAGELTVDGETRDFARPRDSQSAGIALIHQELALVPALTVAENLLLGAEISGRFGIDWEASHAFAKKALDRVGLDVATGTLVRDLGVGQQQLVEIARALSKEARVLVLDEPTAALSSSEAARLLGILRDLAARGTGVVYVSHRLGEVLDVADRVTVLRDGKVVWTGTRAGLTEEALISRMVGRVLADVFPKRAKAPGEVALELSGFSARDEATGREVRDVSLRVRRGEVLGLAGLVGAGRSELLLALVGAWGRRTGGRVRLQGREVAIGSPAEALSMGLALAPEDRKRQGLVLSLDVARNVSLASLPSISRLGVVDANEEVRRAEAAVAELGIRTPTVDTRTESLSGGNQQKVVLAKWRELSPSVLLLDEPTRGVDVGAKAELYALVSRMAEAGTAVLLASSELPELLGMADRIAVMHEGRLAGTLARDEATEERLLRLATGGA